MSIKLSISSSLINHKSFFWFQVFALAHFQKLLKVLSQMKLMQYFEQFDKRFADCNPSHHLQAKIGLPFIVSLPVEIISSLRRGLYRFLVILVSKFYRSDFGEAHS